MPRAVGATGAVYQLKTSKLLWWRLVTSAVYRPVSGVVVSSQHCGEFFAAETFLVAVFSFLLFFLLLICSRKVTVSELLTHFGIRNCYESIIMSIF